MTTLLNTLAADNSASASFRNEPFAVFDDGTDILMRVRGEAARHDFPFHFEMHVASVRLLTEFIDHFDSACSGMDYHSGSHRVRFRYCIRFMFGGRSDERIVVARSRREAILEIATEMTRDRISTKARDSMYKDLLKTAKVIVIPWPESAHTPKFELTEAVLYDVGAEVATQVSGQFYPSNLDKYATLGIDRIDIQQYLWEVVIMRKYLSNMRKNPFIYASRAAFRKSLYVACKRQCMAHYRAHIRSQCRGDITRAGLVCLNADAKKDEKRRPVDLQAPVASGYTDLLREIINSCADPLVSRAIMLLAYEHCDSQEVRRRMDLPKGAWDVVWRMVREHMSQFLDDLRHSVRESDHSVGQWRLLGGGVVSSE